MMNHISFQFMSHNMYYDTKRICKVQKKTISNYVSQPNNTN